MNEGTSKRSCNCVILGTWKGGIETLLKICLGSHLEAEWCQMPGLWWCRVNKKHIYCLLLGDKLSLGNCKLKGIYFSFKCYVNFYRPILYTLLLHYILSTAVYICLSNNKRIAKTLLKYKKSVLEKDRLRKNFNETKYQNTIVYMNCS